MSSQPDFHRTDNAPGDVTAPRQGLTSDEAKSRLAHSGYNEIAEEKRNVLVTLLGYFWGPIPWMIEVAAALSAIVKQWADLAIILVMLFFNALVGFWQAYQAGNAIAQLKKSLAPKARVLRDGHWSVIDARELVPGDVVRLRAGDIVPADIRLADGGALSVDQSALTGESLPVDKQQGELAYSGAVVKQGETVGVVAKTGMQTYFGHTAQLVSTSKTVSHFQKAVLTIGDYLIYLTLGLVAVLLLVGLHRGLPPLELVQFALILTVAAIPVAMPAVLSVTMAIGALKLSAMKAIVSRLEAVEEMAGMDILCSDKTGTLTQNRLTLAEPFTVGANTAGDVILAAALASKAENGDAIDLAVIAGLEDPDALTAYQQQDFVPFDPVSKRTQATVLKDGRDFQVTKGAPQVILALSDGDETLKAQVTEHVNALAKKGYRTLGVARRDDKGNWRFLGLLPLFDPPRQDAADTLARAKEHGIGVKMITGDNIAIAREIAARLGLGRHILSAGILKKNSGEQTDLPEALENADGFAEVFPEHKHAIVKVLQRRNHIVGMTGDGVNDAPALKQADVGIAVSGATDAARAAADVVLTAPGLTVIIKAVEEARRIFERMNAYAVYRITETIRIMLFMVMSMLIYGFYPLTAVMIILLALLNDLPIMAIAYDNTRLSPQPVRWSMQHVLTVATILGSLGLVETFALLIIAKVWLGIGLAELQTILFLKLVIAGHLTLFVARTRSAFYSSPYPARLLLGAVLGTQTVAALIAGFGWFVTPIPWAYIGYIWLYCLAWVFIEDRTKLEVYRHLIRDTARHRNFLAAMQLNLLHPAHGERQTHHHGGRHE